MRKSVTILLTLFLSLAITGLAVAVPASRPLDACVERHKLEYQPEEYDYLLNIGNPSAEAPGAALPEEDAGVGFGDEDPGIDFGDEDFGVDFGDEDPGIDFGDEDVFAE